jgi:catabolite repression protein CreC
METDSTFVAPEGVYTVTEEHKYNVLQVHTANAAPVTYPTKLKTVTIKFLASKTANSQVLSQLLGGGIREKENKKDKDKEKQVEKAAPKDDGLSVSSSETPEDATSPDLSTFSPSPDTVASPTLGHEQLNSLFGAPATVGKKKSVARPKHNMRTTSSTFITRLQNVDNLNRNLQSKQGEATFLFYNSSKSFIWTEAGSKTKVRGPARFGLCGF